MLYVASAMAAVRYCERLELNSQYIVGFGDATGLIAPFAEPGYRESYQREFERREKEAREDPQNYCKLAIAMFHRDVKPRAVLAPLLMNKSSPVNYSHHVDSFV
ncbi:hypothetical protein GCM10011491_19960 [Brucella endophytica]|uniref:Uncharacterized protein n=1 Tax=Brucella endophytica TaxID=1963359 RepID=A0A916SD44_9HYPH|nr:hypothetical protein GCM10011491_19960 [Brucella endophytica]